MLGSFFRKPKSTQHFELDLPHVDKEEHSEIVHKKTADDPSAPIIVPPPHKPLFAPEHIALISILLMLIATTGGIWSWSRYSRLRSIRQVETQQHEKVLDSLEQVKFGLEDHLNQLQADFANLSSENDTLAQRLATATNIIQEKETAIEAVKNQNTREEAALRAQVQRLQTIKDRYETIIAVLQQKNEALTEENARLRGTADSLTLQVSELGKQLEAQMRKTMSAQFKATAFRLEMHRRNDQPTLRARRTRELNVLFDLNQVPAAYQGNQQLYLSITDDKGVPIETKNPIQVTIKTEKGPVAIIAQAVQVQNVIDNQRVALQYKLEDRLKKGTYIVSVYSEKGALLGVAGFRLT